MTWAVRIEEYADDYVVAELRRGDEYVKILAGVRFGDRRLTLYGLHALGDGPNRLGTATLLRLGRWALEALDLDELRIEGATRTSGARPGHAPRPIVFRRT
jgi:hypothetical protein